MPRPDLVAQASEDDAGEPVSVWTGEVIETNDIVLGLVDDIWVWSLMDSMVPEDDDAEKHPGLEPLVFLSYTTLSHRLIDTRIWPPQPPHQPALFFVATRP